MNYKIAFLGGGAYGEPIHAALKKRFGLVPPDQADLWVVASYGRILKPEEFNKPRYGALVCHPSLLPQYRGASPVQQALLNGDRRTGVTIIKMDERPDHGPLIASQQLLIAPNERLAALISRLAGLSADLVVKVIPRYISGQAEPVQQDHGKATFTNKLNRTDGELDLAKPAEFLERQVRAYWPWPGSYLWVQDQGGNTKRLIVHQAHIENGKLIPDIVQIEGKQALGWVEFKRGWRGKLPAELGA